MRPRARLFTIALAIGLLAAGAPARAGAVSKADADALCRAAADLAGKHADAVFALCVANEDRAQAEFRHLPPKVSAKVAKRCAAATQPGAAGPEVVQKGCKAVAQLRRAPK